MSRNFGNPAQVVGGFQEGSLAVPREIASHRHRKRLRGIVSVGALLVMAAACYTVVFVLIDKWYTGGSLGIL